MIKIIKIYQSTLNNSFYIVKPYFQLAAKKHIIPKQSNQNKIQSNHIHSKNHQPNHSKNNQPNHSKNNQPNHLNAYQKNSPIKNKTQSIRVSANFAKENQQILEILKKPDLQDFDLVCIFEKIQVKSSKPTEEISHQIKKAMNNLKSINFIHIISLIKLNQSLGIFSYPNIFKNQFLRYLEELKEPFNFQLLAEYPSAFLKNICLNLFQRCAKRSTEELIQALKYTGQLMSLNQLKKVDGICYQQAQEGFISLQNVIRLMSIFRQLKRKGQFTYLAENMISEKKNEISNKSLISAVINFLQLSNEQSHQQLESVLTQRIIDRTVGENIVITFIQILHKYKKGRKQTWLASEQYFIQRNKRVPPQHAFVFLSGFYRNHIYRSQLFQIFIQIDPQMKYLETLSQNQYVQLFIVLYANTRSTSNNNEIKTQIAAFEARIKQKDLKSVYLQIKNLFMALIENNISARKQLIKKSYPDEVLFNLLSIIFENFEVVNEKERKQYEEELINRFGKEVYEANKHMLAVEEFVRYKLMSIFKIDK